MMSRTRRRDPRLGTVIVTSDGTAWCTACGWEPDVTTQYGPLIMLWSRQHAGDPAACERYRAERRASMSRHPSAGGSDA